MRNIAQSIFSLLLILSIAGCGDDETGSNTSGFDRMGMLEDLSGNIIIPAYDSLNEDVVALDLALEAFINTPDQSNLDNARSAFSTSYHSWQRAAFWEFGPAFNVLLNTSVNSFPADRISIESRISSGDFDFSAFASQDEKGFPAIGYFLYGIADSDAGIIEMFTTGANADNRKQYLNTISDELSTRIGEVNDAWTGAEDYRSTFINSDGTDVGSSVSQIVNELNKFVERETRDEKIGIPLGKRSQGIAIPAEVEAGYSEMSISLATENIEAIYDFYMGVGVEGDKVGLYDYLEALGSQYEGGLLADAIKLQFEAAIKEVAEIPSPYQETVESNPTPANEAYLELQKLVILLKVDMPSALGVLITYQDNDGD